jgi:hypothetical protein
MFVRYKFQVSQIKSVYKQKYKSRQLPKHKGCQTQFLPVIVFRLYSVSSEEENWNQVSKTGTTVLNNKRDKEFDDPRDYEKKLKLSFEDIFYDN